MLFAFSVVNSLCFQHNPVWGPAFPDRAHELVHEGRSHPTIWGWFRFWPRVGGQGTLRGGGGGMGAATGQVRQRGEQGARRKMQIPDWLPYLVFAGGGLLGGYFGRSKVLFGQALLALAYTLLPLLAPAAAHGDIRARYLLAALAWSIPANLLLLYHRREVGLLGPRAARRLGSLLLQAALVCAGLLCADRLLPLLVGWPPGWWPLSYGVPRVPLALLLALVGTASVLLLGRQTDRGALRWAYGGALLLAGLVLAGPPLPTLGGWPLDRLLLVAAGLLLAGGLVRLSHRLAFQDALTGLPGRRALEEALDRLGPRYCLAMVDLDHFKKVNDRWGHDTGDEVLRFVASRLARVDGGGQAYRYGGEEFSVLFPGRRKSEVLQALEGLRVRIAQTPLAVRNLARPRRKPARSRSPRRPPQSFSVSVSIGVAEPGRRHTTPHQVLEAADRALYKAKRQGRNRVVA